MNKELGKEYASLEERKRFLKDNCDVIVDHGYMKQFAPEELITMREELSSVAIKINDIDEEKKIINEQFKDRLKPLSDDMKELLRNIKNGAEFKNENCYQFLDEETKMVGLYNSEGNLVSVRPAKPDELQTTTFSIGRKTGTNN